MKTQLNSIGKEKAIALSKTNWWKEKTAREIVQFQLFTEELCMNFGDFHQAVEETLGRPVWTHEFAMNYNGLVKEFLGEQPAPTMEEIINLIPEEKRIVVCL